MNDNQEYIDLYNHLEESIRNRFKLDDDKKPVAFLEQRPEYRYIKSELKYCREVRNFFSHKKRLGDEYPVTVNPGMVEFIKDVIYQFEHPQLLSDIMIPISKVFFTNMDGSVLEAVTVMKEKSFTHIPILEDGYVKGVFSENTIFSSIIRDKIIEIDESTKFSEFDEFLPPEKHQTETIIYEPRNMMKTELDIVFAEARKRQERIGMVLVTQNGKPNEKLLGIITVWDLP